MKHSEIVADNCGKARAGFYRSRGCQANFSKTRIGDSNIPGKLFELA
jgi:hypothetical protein